PLTLMLENMSSANTDRALPSVAFGSVLDTARPRMCWSPELNSAGNSLVGMAALELLSQRIGWSVF
ncbi:glutaminase, partial [Pseudomonas protegens]|uniref:glutaminase n=1 Tax=Pseudomonas protegens TaxID=380021 RepID=UPI0034D5BD7C